MVMENKLFRLRDVLLAKFADGLQDSMILVTSLATICLFCFPLFFFLYPHSEKAWLDISGTVFSVIILSLKYYPGFPQRYLPPIWCLFLIFVLPFNFTYNLLLQPTAISYHLGQMLMVMLMAIIITDVFFLLVMMALGVYLAWVVYSHSWINLLMPNGLHGMVSVYVLGFIFGIVLSQKITRNIRKIAKRNQAQRQQIEVLQAFGNNFADQLRKPLAMIRKATVCDELWRQLIADYASSNHFGLAASAQADRKLNALSNLFTTIDQQAARINRFIDMQLLNFDSLQRSVTQMRKDYREISVTKSIEHAIRYYDFSSDKERERVIWKPGNDFHIIGDDVLLEYILYNLLKNALYFIRVMGKGSITIELSEDRKLLFTDTAQGIASDVLPHIFDQFFSCRENGTGTGLAFCRWAMESMHGTITCESEYGEYTRFILEFPVEQVS